MFPARQRALDVFLLILGIQRDGEPFTRPTTPTKKKQHALRPVPALYVTTGTKRQALLKLFI
jgi:hypothetical protein